MKERIEFKTYTKMTKNSIADYKELITYAQELGQKALAFTDYNSVEIFPKVFQYLKQNPIRDFQVIYGTVVPMLENQIVIPVTILVRNQTGLKNLYRIISSVKTSNLDKYGRQVTTRKELVNLSEGLLYGLDVENMYPIYENQTEEQIVDDWMWYDFIEIKSPTCSSFKNSEDYFKRIIQLAKESRKIVIATGEVHYVRKEEQKDYQMLFPKENIPKNKYLKSTKEMMLDFQFLNDDTFIEEVVIKNPNRLLKLIENVEILSDQVSFPTMKNQKEIFIQKVYRRAHQLYGQKLPSLIENRIKEELYGKEGKEKGIVNKNYEIIYLVYQKLATYSRKLGYPAYARGKVASSFIAYLLGITEVNPLPPHYICSHCKQIVLDGEKNLFCGLDLPDKKCPQCHRTMRKDGFDIPYETFLGYDVDKMPDIDMNFADEIQSEMEAYITKLFGKKKVLKAGTIGVYSEGKAFHTIEKMEKEKSLTLSKEEECRIVNHLTGVKIQTGQHPGGIIIIPKEKEIVDFTPVAYPNDIKKYNWKSTHFDYHELTHSLMKVDVLSSPIPTILAKLEKITHRKTERIRWDDPWTFELINRRTTEAFLEFDKSLTKNLLKKFQPTNFTEFVKLIGICHGEGTYYEEKKQINEKMVWDETICCCEDIMNYLIAHKMNPKKAYEVMDFIRKGRIQKDKETWNTIQENMKKVGIDEEWIEDCSKIEFVLPKAHIISCALPLFHLAWYQTHFPAAFKSQGWNTKKENS